MFKIQQADPFITELAMRYQLFDHYRIVNADTYEVSEWKGGRLLPQPERCYAIWKRSAACQNCISRCAVDENRPIIKLETVDDHIFLIQSLPLPEMGPHMALELVRDVTDSLLVNGPDHLANLPLVNLIRDMNDLVTHDSYTGLYNKQFIEHELHCRTLDWDGVTPFAIALFDIDRFKMVNDTYGHLAGDQVILTIARVLTACAKQSGGWAGRVGGDEFLLAFQGINEAEAKRRVETLCDDLSQVEFGAAERAFHISVSAGVAEYRLETGDWQALFNRADQAMYYVKQSRAAKRTEP